MIFPFVPHPLCTTLKIEKKHCCAKGGVYDS